MQFNKETPTAKFVIQEKAFDIPRPFAEGHTCTGAEAGVLNQTLAENTRNNMAARIKKAVEDGTYDQNAMQGEIDQYLEEYDFGVRRGRGPVDPVEREARNIAVDAVKTAIRNAGMKVADVDTADINRLADEAIADNPDITKEAKRRVEQRNKLTVGDMDLSSVGSGAAAADEAEA